MVALIFPGQGSQYVGMASHLFDEFPEVHQIASDIVGFSLKEVCLEDPSSLLQTTKYTQPALFLVNALYFLDFKRKEDRNINLLAGHSLGEYSALFAASAFDFETGMRIVQKRAELMDNQKEGAMLAVIGISSKDLEELLENNNFLEQIDIANYNAPEQTVLSGKEQDINIVSNFLENKVPKCVKLPVSGAFHSREMTPIRSRFLNFLMEFEFFPLQTPVVSNLFACPYENIFIQETLAHQLTGAVQWVKSINYIKEQGEKEFLELGPRDILSKLTSKVLGVIYEENTQCVKI
ncbi:MAG: ACP S-malonyltransferase [Silvanigrellaceae bacterium]|nr:ACP S-malonyltransferase [Silvanigrellaceae bacterium]